MSKLFCYYIYYKMPNCRACIVLPKTEWDRLQKQAAPAQKSAELIHYEEQQKYLKAMEEKSKEWTRNWPDTVEGCVVLYEKHKKEVRAKNKEIVENFQEKQKQIKLERVKEIEKEIAVAREKIFYNSSYGRQLISAILESKSIEEREAQMEFEEYKKQKEADREKLIEDKIASMDNNLYDLHKKDTEKQERKKQADIEFAKINKTMHEHHLLGLAKAKKQQINDELEDTKRMNQLLDVEANAMEHCKIQEKEKLEQYETDQKVFKEKQLKAQQVDDAINKVWQNYNDMVKCKEKLVWKKIIEDRESDVYKNLYERVEKSQNNEKEAYEKFVDKGIKKLEEKQLRKDEQSQNQQRKSHNSTMQLVEDGKLAEEYNRAMKHCNKCICVRQSLFTKPRKRIMKDIIGAEYAPEREKQSFLEPSKRLLNGLKKRTKEPRHWNGVKEAHEQFLRHASATLEECKNKHQAMRLIENYKKQNCLNSATLPISEN